MMTNQCLLSVSFRSFSTCTTTVAKPTRLPTRNCCYQQDIHRLFQRTGRRTSSSSDCRSARIGMSVTLAVAVKFQDRRASPQVIHSLHSIPGKNVKTKDMITEESNVTCVEARLATYRDSNTPMQPLSRATSNSIAARPTSRDHWLQLHLRQESFFC